MTTQELFDAIKNFDCEPGVFKVYLMASSTLDGFDAFVDFRSFGNCSSVSSHAGSPEVALEKLYATMKNNFSRCPTCGQHIPIEDAK